jgi:hypothetical protein
MAQEPLGLRCAGFSPAFARTESGILTSRRSTGRFPPRLQRYENAPLPLVLANKDTASADGLKSRPLSARLRLTGELLRTL